MYEIAKQYVKPFWILPNIEDDMLATSFRSCYFARPYDSIFLFCGQPIRAQAARGRWIRGPGYFGLHSTGEFVCIRVVLGFILPYVRARIRTLLWT